MERKRRKQVFMGSGFFAGGRRRERGERSPAIFIVVWLVVSVVCGTVWAVEGDLGLGDGTPENPYLIEDLADFDVFADQNNAATYWSVGVHTKLMTDIDLSDRTYTTAVIASIQYYWDPHSPAYVREGVPFSGVFDGNGFTIFNLTIDTIGNRDYLGLFGQIEGLNAEVKNLRLEYITILGGGISSNVGGLVGEHVSGLVMNCYVNASIQADGAIGGLAGASSAPISNCYSTGSVSGSALVGGLVGWNTGPVTNCYSTCTVIAHLIVSVVAPGDFSGLMGENE